MSFHLFLSIADFAERGGWVEDSQFIEVMGLPYLLAHGLGTPVADAWTTVTVPTDGDYRLFAYTYNWNAPWKPEYAPGCFEVAVGGHRRRFGDTGDAWGWQGGDALALTAGEHTLTLHDLTGCEGRCAAILLTDGGEPLPPTAYLTDSGLPPAAYDYVVVGGGITGIAAALVAARGGLRTALVQDRPVVGGNNSSEVRVWLSGKYQFPPFPHLGDVTAELEQSVRAILAPRNRAENYEDGRKLALLLAEEKLTLYMHHALVGAEVQDGTIAAVRLLDLDTCRYKSVAAPLYADCTGDGVLGAAAGADYEMTTSGHMELSNFWNIVDTGAESVFPRCPWAMDLSEADFPGRLRAGGTDPEGERRAVPEVGNWSWGAGYEHNPITRAEYARDTNLRAMYGAFDVMKNVDGDYKTYKIEYSAHIAGKRESRRLLGPHVLTKNDLLEKHPYPDALVGIEWGLDLHTPNRRYYRAYVEGDAFLCSDGREVFDPPYYMPYRCLYSRNVKNLFMAGRCISTTHDALGPVRVMRTCGMMGEAVSAAAILCRRHGTTPDGIYQSHLGELLAWFR